MNQEPENITLEDFDTDEDLIGMVNKVQFKDTNKEIYENKFSTEIQSTQRIEVCNKIIKDRLNRASHLTEVVEEIQRLFNDQSKKAILNEYKNKILTKGIPNITEEYFSEIAKVLREYLTLQILQKQCDQMTQSLCYDLTDDSYQYNMAREDDYNQPQFLLLSLLENIPHNSVLEVWKEILTYQIIRTEIAELPSPEPLSFQHLEKFRETSNIQQKQGSKQKFELGIKKFIDEMKDELFDKQHDTDHLFIGDLLHIPHK
ncbi:9871_t:CDS:2, partial [Cetraspora pellucida]